MNYIKLVEFWTNLPIVAYIRIMPIVAFIHLVGQRLGWCCSCLKYASYVMQTDVELNVFTCVNKIGHKISTIYLPWLFLILRKFSSSPLVLYLLNARKCLLIADSFLLQIFWFSNLTIKLSSNCVEIGIGVHVSDNSVFFFFAFYAYYLMKTTWYTFMYLLTRFIYSVHEEWYTW